MISANGIRLIKAFESFSPIPYICPAGYKTIGYGHVVKRGEDFDLPLSLENGERLLMLDIGRTESALFYLIRVFLNQNQWDALTSWTFNLGTGSLQSSTLRMVLNRGEYDEAPAQMRRWVYAGGRKIKGLVRRRTVEAQLFAQ